MIGVAIGFLVTLISTPWLRRRAIRLGRLDHPGERKSQEAPVPLLGGAAMAIGLVSGLTAAVISGAPPLLLGLFPGLLLAFWMGALDDKRPAGLSPSSKLGLLLLAAVVALPALDALAPSTPSVLHRVLTVVWIVAIATVFNLSDNMNGLSAGLVLGPLCAAHAAFGDLSALGWVTAACAAGFLPFNYPRARIYMGDAGAHLLGLSLGVISCPFLFSAKAGALVAVPLVDAVFVTILRLSIGQRPWIGDRRHLSHQLVTLGLPEWAAVAVLVAIGATVAGVVLG